MKRSLAFIAAGFFAVALVIGVATAMSSKPACAAVEQVSFSEDVMPILRERCVACHQTGGEGYNKSGLDLTSYVGLMKGTKNGPMIIPGDPDMSNLMWLIDWRADPALRMPHNKKKLSSCDRDTIRTWIRQGANNN